MIDDIERTTYFNMKIHLSMNLYKMKIQKQVQMIGVRSENIYIPIGGFNILPQRKIKFMSDFKH